MCSTTINFTLVPGVKMTAVENCSCPALNKKQLLPGEKIYDVNITNHESDAAVQFDILPSPLEGEEVISSIASISPSAIIPEGVEFDDEVENKLIIPANTLSEKVLPYLLCEVSIKVNGVKQASAIILIK